MAEPIWQFRKFYGPHPDLPDGWTEWFDVTEGSSPYSPRKWLDDNWTNSGKIEFRVKPVDCARTDCDAVVEWDGLCALHAELEREAWEYNDRWPDLSDFKDEWDIHGAEKPF